MDEKEIKFTQELYKLRKDEKTYLLKANIEAFIARLDILKQDRRKNKKHGMIIISWNGKIFKYY